MTVSEKIVADLVANDVQFVTTVPCKQLAGVIDAVDKSPDIYHIPSNKEDEGMGLWEVFNRVQENIINGNFYYNTKSGKQRQARIIKNFKQDLDLNRSMFSKAMEYAS